MPEYFDIIVDMFIAGIPGKEYERLLKWFYSYREFLRWIMKYLLIYDSKLIDEKTEMKLLKTLPEEQRKIYQEIFEEADAPDCCQMTYLMPSTEVERRKEILRANRKEVHFLN